MKRLGLITLLLFIIILSGCTKEDDLFEKKLACANYKHFLQEEIDKEAKRHAGESYSAYIVEIFYSKKKNSCLAVTRSSSIINNNEFGYYYINDLLSSEIVAYEEIGADLSAYHEVLHSLKEE